MKRDGQRFSSGRGSNVSVRSDILGHIETALKGITDVGDVLTGKWKFEEADLESLNYPALFIFQGSDNESQNSDFSKELFDWNVIIEAWCADTTVEALFAAIHTAMAADSTLGGHAIQSRRIGSQIFALDPGRGIISMQQTHIIQYEHPNGQP